MLAKASPLKPYVPIDVRSSKVLSLDVVNLSQRIGRSSFYILVSSSDKDQTLHVTVTNVDSVAIVGNLKQLQPSIFDNNLKRSRPGVDSILNQFFQSMNRSDYDFAGSNLVYHILVKSLDKPISYGSTLALLRVCYLDPLGSLGS